METAKLLTGGWSEFTLLSYPAKFVQSGLSGLQVPSHGSRTDLNSHKKEKKKRREKSGISREQWPLAINFLVIVQRPNDPCRFSCCCNTFFLTKAGQTDLHGCCSPSCQLETGNRAEYCHSQRGQTMWSVCEGPKCGHR